MLYTWKTNEVFTTVCVKNVYTSIYLIYKTLKFKI